MAESPKSADFNHVREKRSQTLVSIWKILVKNGKLNDKRFNLSKPLVNEVIEQYISDYEILKKRYKIDNTKIQLHKVAGLMTAAILKYRPIVPLVDSYESHYETCANEILAIFQGLTICAEYSEDKLFELMGEPWFEPWFLDFLFLLHRRNHTPESIIFVYETLCRLRLSEGLTADNYGL